MKEQTNYDILIDKLDRFIRKYYINRTIRGALYWVALMLMVFLAYGLLEYYFYFGRGVRKFLFFSFVITAVGGLAYWVLHSVAQMYRLGRRISHEQAAVIIGEHFTDVRDKLLNILQLRRQADATSSPELAFASINQKTEEISVIPFRNAIDLSRNRRYLRYALPPLLVLLALLVAAPGTITDSTARIIHNNRDYERAAPYRFVLPDSDHLSVVQYEDFDLDVRVEGTLIPAEAFIQVDDFTYRMKRETPGNFSYRFRNVHKDTRFRVYAGRVSSADMDLAVLKKPNLVTFSVQLDYPSYTGRRNERLQNIGDLVVPEGTRITWDFQTMNTDVLDIRFQQGDGSVPTNATDGTTRQGIDLFTTNVRALRDMSYTLYLSNTQLPRKDSIRYAINVIPDLHPTISVEQFIDSLDPQLVFFVGTAGDDYGFTGLSFNYQIADERGQVQTVESLPLRIREGTQFQFDHTVDIATLELPPGNELTYYFEVSDNDRVNGSKTTRSQVMKFRKPSIAEYEEMQKENSEAIKDVLDESRLEALRLQEELRRLREKLLQERNLEWQQKQEIERLMERQKQLHDQMRDAQDRFQQNLKNQDEFSRPSDELMEKQQRLEELFDRLMSDELRDLMDQFKDMMETLERDDALRMLESFELSEEELAKELDRLLELFRQMEVEQMLQQQIDKLEKLADEQDMLSEQTRDEQHTTDELQEQQEDIQEQFDSIRDDMQSIEEKNEQLMRPKNLDGTEEQMDRIDQDMDNSQEQLQQEDRSGSSGSQRSAAQRMRDLAQQLGMQMQQGQMEQMQEDMATLRQLLENLVTLSFEQEDLMDALGITAINTPEYVNQVQNQFKIKDDFKVAEDTLQALSKRVIQIESFVTEKVTEIKDNLRQSISELEERRKAQASEHQHRTMKNLNDLALMLSEVMQQMQQQMAMMMPGDQMCTNPGGNGQGRSGRVPLDKITEGQENLNDEMQEMMRGRQEGDKGSSEQFARMAARQAALRKALRELQQEQQQRGQGDDSLDPIINAMDNIETQLVNKQLTNEMLRRQQEILTRLLEAERAEREREMDHERKAEQARQTERTMPPALEEYIRKREAEIESFRTASPALRPYYKFLVEEYYNALKQQ